MAGNRSITCLNFLNNNVYIFIFILKLIRQPKALYSAFYLVPPSGYHRSSRDTSRRVTNLIRGGIRGISLLLLVLLLFTGFSVAKIGYQIDARVGGSAFHIERSTQNINFSLDENVIGSGNFSRFGQITGFSGIKSDERSSAVRGGDMSLNDKVRLKSIEGPVTILIELESREENVTIDPNNPTLPKPIEVDESADISIDERWATAYANSKKISYQGPGIRTRESHENNGDIMASSVDSRGLDKETLYTTYINRTMIDVEITPTSVNLKQASNKSSFYALNLKSIGLTSLDMIRRDASHNLATRVSEDYAGQHNITLKVSMNDFVNKKLDEEEWLPCCSGGYSDMYKWDRVGLSSDSIFNCACASSPSAPYK